MDSSSVEVRLFLQHLSQWMEAVSHGRTAEARSAVEAIRLRGRWICAEPEFRERLRGLINGSEAAPEADAALRAMCAFLSALTPDHKA